MNARRRTAVPDVGVDVWYELCVELFPTSSQIAGRRFPAAVASVAVGGAVGSSARWAIDSMVDITPGDWPWSTLTVNLVGCLLIGVIAGTMARGSLPWDFLVTGVLGPHSNAHGPNEFLHLPTARRITCCVAEVLAQHAAR